MDGMGTGLFVSQQYGYFVAELYHQERNHQGVDNRLLIGTTAIRTAAGPVRKRERVGGLLNYYYREAA